MCEIIRDLAGKFAEVKMQMKMAPTLFTFIAPAEKKEVSRIVSSSLIVVSDVVNVIIIVQVVLAIFSVVVVVIGVQRCGEFRCSQSRRNGAHFREFNGRSDRDAYRVTNQYVFQYLNRYCYFLCHSKIKAHIDLVRCQPKCARFLFSTACASSCGFHEP